MIECPNCGNKLENDGVDVCPHCNFSMIDEPSEGYKNKRYLLGCLILMLIIATPMITIMMFFPLSPP